MTDRLPIVLCCAEESETGLVAVVDVLHREGYAPEVVPGVEADAGLLTAAADRVQGAALFVLCQSDDLDRFQVRRLEGLFSARKGPLHRMVMVDVARRSPAAIVSEVRAAARELARGPGGRDVDDGHYMRDVVMPTSVAAVPGATVPQRAPRSRGRTTPRSSPVVHEPQGISEEALGLESGETEIVDPGDLQGRVRKPEVLLATNTRSRAALVEAGFEPDGLASDGVPLAVAEDFPMVGESSQDVEIRGAPGRVGWDSSGPIDVERVARSPRSDPRAETDETPLPSASSPIDIGRAGGAPPEVVRVSLPPRRAGRLVLLVLAAAGMAGVVTMAALHASAPVGVGPAEEVHERGVGGVAAAADHEVTPPVAPETAGAAEGAVVPEVPPPAEASTGSEAPSEASTSGASEGGTTADPAAGGSTTGDAGDASDGEPESGEPESGDDTEPEAVEPLAGDGGGKVVPPPPTGDRGADSGEGSIEGAIAAGRVQELGNLLAINTGPSTVTWDEAVTRCARRKVSGVGGWRLASKQQLSELRKAKILTHGTFWSRSVVGADEALVLDAATGRTHQWLKIEPNGRVLCVRGRP